MCINKCKDRENRKIFHDILYIPFSYGKIYLIKINQKLLQRIYSRNLNLLRKYFKCFYIISII